MKKINIITAIMMLLSLTSCNENVLPEKQMNNTSVMLSDSSDNVSISEIEIQNDMNIYNSELYNGRIYMSGSSLQQNEKVFINRYNLEDGKYEKIAVDTEPDTWSSVLEISNSVYFLSQSEESGKSRIVRIDENRNEHLSEDLTGNITSVGVIGDKLWGITSDFSIYIMDKDLNQVFFKNISDSVFESFSGMNIFFSNAISDDKNIYLLLKNENETETTGYVIKWNAENGIEHIWDNPGDLNTDNFGLMLLPDGNIGLTGGDERKEYIDEIDVDTYQITNRFTNDIYQTELNGTADGYYIGLTGSLLELINPLDMKVTERYSISEEVISDNNVSVFDFSLYNNNLYYFSCEENSGNFIISADLEGNTEVLSYSDYNVMKAEIYGTDFEVSGEYESGFQLHKYENNGTETVSDIAVKEKVYSLNALNSVGENLLFLGSLDVGFYVGIMDESGNIILDMKCSECDITAKKINEDYYLFYTDCDNNFIRKKFENNSYEEVLMTFKDTAYTEMYCGGEEDKYDIYLRTDNSLYGYDADKNELTMILDNIRDLGISNILSVYYDEVLHSGIIVSNDSRIYKLSVNNNSSDKQFVDIAVMSEMNSSGNIHKMISDFNLKDNNSGYILREQNFKNYDELDLAVSSGNIPDIIVSDGNYRITEYAEKGMFTDLKEIFSENEYLDNIININTVNNKLYQVTPYFKTDTLIVRDEDDKFSEQLNYDKFIELLETNENAFNIDCLTREELLTLFLPAVINDYVDADTCSCNLDNGDFIKLIEAVNNHYSDYNEDGNNTENYESDMYLCSVGSFGGLTQYDWIDENTFTITGFPSENGGKHYVTGEIYFSVSEKCKDTETAFNFIREFFDDEFQDAFSDSPWFPVKKTSFTKKLNSERSENISNNTAEKIEKFIESVTDTLTHNERTEEIIIEEAALFFAGENSAEESVKRMCKKTELYLNEIK